VLSLIDGEESRWIHKGLRHKKSSHQRENWCLQGTSLFSTMICCFLCMYFCNMYSIRYSCVQVALCAFDKIHYITIDLMEFTQASTGETWTDFSRRSWIIQGGTYNVSCCKLYLWHVGWISQQCKSLSMRFIMVGNNNP